MDGVLLGWIVFIFLMTILLGFTVWIGFRRWERDKHSVTKKQEFLDGPP